MMKETIETERLLMRPMKETDFEAYLQYAQDPQVMQYIREIESVELIKEQFDGYADEWDGKEGHWMGAAIVLKDSDQLIGDIGFRYSSLDNQQIEIGYKFNQQFHGKGYGTEAVTAFVKMILKDWSFHKLVAFCEPRNIASFKLMEKLGMQREAHFKEHFKFGDEWQDEYAYGALRRDLLNLDL